MENLLSVIYVSLATEGYSVEKAEKMLKAAREERQLTDITGVAVFANGMVMTIIEGEAENVRKYYKGVNQYIGVGLNNVIKILEKSISTRSFPQYSLAFKPYAEHLRSLDDFMEETDRLYFEQFLSKQNIVSKIVKEFIADKIPALAHLR